MEIVAQPSSDRVTIAAQQIRRNLHDAWTLLSVKLPATGTSQASSFALGKLPAPHLEISWGVLASAPPGEKMDLPLLQHLVHGRQCDGVPAHSSASS